MTTRRRWLHAALAALLALAVPGQETAAADELRLANGRPTDPAWFPLAVWLQSPQHARRYRELGINLYVGLWQGPTRAQLDALAAAGMPTICAQNDIGLEHGGATILGWLHHDEPDNAQKRSTFGYGPPIPPADVVAEYERMHRRDPTRPVLLNLGQGAAWDGWHGRGVRTNHPEDYPEYVKGCDVVSFDIYPVTHTHRDVQGRLEYVGRGVQRLRAASRDQKPVWACIETTRIDHADRRPSPAQVRSMVWIAICSGADGIVYFAHEFAPRFVEAGLLAHADVAAAVRDVNAEVLGHAPVLNTRPLAEAVEVGSTPPVELAVRAHRHAGSLHLFVASLAATAAEVRLRPTDGPYRTLRRDGVAAEPDASGAFAVALAGYGFVHCRLEP
ncbi:MAG: beta-galactosidase [Planctomycetes bacterium]|nr:beta-galactosidase [Planctomycetota bacterium]